MRMLIVPLLLVGAAQAAGCAGDQEEEIASTEAEIRGGVLTAEGEFEAVGVLGNGCTATLISNTAALTAGHCVCDDATPINCQTRTTFTFKNVRPLGSSTRGNVTVGADIFIHPDFNVDWNANDYVVLQLDTPANQLVQVTPMQVAKALPSVGEVHTMIGFGGFSNAGSSACDNPLDGRQRKVSVALDVIEDLGHTAPNDPKAGITLTYNDAKGVCRGDSGGPVINAAGRVLGVSSTSNLSNNSKYDAVAYAYGWIQGLACPQFSPADPDTAFCSELCPCPSAQTDCDFDSDCASGAACIDNVGAGVGFPDFWDVCWANDQVATLWRDTNFTGGSRELPLGQWDVGDLGAVVNDGLSSMKIPPGLTLRAFQEAGCTGDVQAFSGNVSDIVGTVRDNVSCVRVLPGVTVYTGKSFAGLQQTFEVGNFNAATFVAGLNDQISSLIATPGISVRLCPESGPPGGIGWGASCTDFSGKVASIGGAIDENTSHVEVRAGVTLYRESRFWGVEQSLPAGSFGASALSTVGENQVSSLVVAPGMKARVCTGGVGAGTCKTFTGWVAFVGPQLNDQISSVVVSPL